MKSFLIAVLAILAVDALSDSEIWEDYKTKHNKMYENEEEEQHRFNIFLTNKQIIEEHNTRYAAGLETYSMGFNPFTDLTDEEFDKFKGTFTVSPAPKDVVYYEDDITDVPDTVDWRDKGVLGPIRNQGCGDCWAHGITGALEAQYALKHEFVNFSRQNLIDCTFVYGNGGCVGGKSHYTYNYLRELGIVAEDDYPYEGGKNSFCRFNATKLLVKVSHGVFIHNREESTMHAVANRGPVTAIIDARDPLRHFHEGVYSNPQCTNHTNHMILIVGYGTEKNVPYWLVKNSWGTKWGVDGYAKILRNSNMCAIGHENSFPVLAE